LPTTTPDDVSASPSASGRCRPEASAALTYLAALRAPLRRQRRRNAALLGYGTALATGAWAVPYLVRTAQAARTGRWRDTAVAEVLPSVLPALLPAVCLLAVTAMAHQALWRGPVLLDEPTGAWLLTAPVPRGPLLRPKFRAAAARSAALGALLGAVAGFVLHAFTASGWPASTAAGAVAGGLTALAGVAVGALVERYDEALATRRWLVRAGWAPAASATTLAVLAVAGAVPEALRHALLWSGPWPALVAVAAPVAALLVAADRAVPRIPARTLRRRATTQSRVAASLMTLDVRQARSTVAAASGARATVARPALRLPPPLRRAMVVPWRDATCLLRAPRHLGWAALWCVCALALTAPPVTVPAAVCAVVAGYLAAARLTESARLEHDDLRRRASLPHSARRLTLAHAVVPVSLSAFGTGLGGAALAVAGAGSSAHLLLTVAAPALVGAALLDAGRGSVPPHLLVGVETPMGNTGPFQVLFWYLRGPFACMVLLVPPLVTAPGVVPTLWTALGGAALLGWAAWTAPRTMSGR
jgi:hypothetical protein